MQYLQKETAIYVEVFQIYNNSEKFKNESSDNKW